MEALSVSSAGRRRRLMGLVVAFYLIHLSKAKEGTIAIQNNGNRGSDLITENPPSKARPRLGGILSSVLPPLPPGSGEGHGKTMAEVQVLVNPRPPKEPPDPFERGLVRASSIMMEYEEDTREMALSKETEHPHRIRHDRSRNLLPLPDDPSTANDAPAAEKEADSMKGPARPKGVLRVPVKLVIYDEDSVISQAPQLRPFRVRYKPSRNGTWVAMHSPLRIYIPVRFNDLDTKEFQECIQCPANFSVTASRGETNVLVPIPTISVCKSLAHERGRINIAVTSGPRPGLKVSEGHYPTEIIIWKHQQMIQTCQYSLNVVVKHCKEVLPPNDGSVECSKGNIWGSKCKFSCNGNFVLYGHQSIICDRSSGKISWSSDFPKCKKTEGQYIAPVERNPCEKPEKPDDGMVVCHSNKESIYPDGSVCQFFCFSGFLIEGSQSNNSLVVCKNGHWTPHSKVSCVATFCKEPKQPHYGYVICNSEFMKDAPFKPRYRNGTACHLQCDDGFVVPRSQQRKNKITCTAPHWTVKFFPECKQALTPVPDHRDCNNLVLMANRKGFVRLKPPRFHLVASAATKTLRGNCTYSGKTGIGSYINHCTAFDKELNTTGSCTYLIEVKEKSCPPLSAVPHATVRCDPDDSNGIFPVRAVCEYVCDEGYVIPVPERKRMSRRCMPRLRWRPEEPPSCRRAVPPRPRKRSCVDQRVFLHDGEALAKIKLPKFKSIIKGSTVKVKCSIKGFFPVGNYTNDCEAYDVKLGLTSHCVYNISVQAKGCMQLKDIPLASVECSDPKIGSNYLTGTSCEYKCHEGYVIPTSLLSHAAKTCVDGQQWNDTLIPTCVSQDPPVPMPDSCLDHFTSESDLDSFLIGVPEFKSSYRASLQVGCVPSSIDSYGEHTVNCTAFDPELRVSGSCSFVVDVRNPNDIAELSREEVTCLPPEEIKSGILECNTKNPQPWPAGTMCEVKCNESFAVPKSQVIYSASVCMSNGKWNVTNLQECVEIEPPYLISGCLDYEVNVSSPSDAVLHVPDFHTSHGALASVHCTPSTLGAFGLHTVLCEAVDDELETTNSCRFLVNVLDVDIVESTPAPYPATSISDYEFKPCQLLEPPRMGYINCSDESPVAFCEVGCEGGYRFPEDFLQLFRHKIECDGNDGLWDFQRAFHEAVGLPNCLGYLPNTTMEVSMNFSAFVDKCEADFKYQVDLQLKDRLVSLNRQRCLYVDCESQLQTQCYFNPAENRFRMNATWTLQIAYNPLEYKNTKNVSVEENYLEDVIQKTRLAVKSEGHFREDLSEEGIEVDSESFKLGFFLLSCQKGGFAVHQNTNICVECPPETFESNNVCFPCPSDTHQPDPGQSECICPDDTVWTGDYHHKACSSSIADLADARSVDLGERYA